jgi:hypothetical protein
MNDSDAIFMMPDEVRGAWTQIESAMHTIGLNALLETLQQHRRGNLYDIEALMYAVTAWASCGLECRMSINIGSETLCIAYGASMPVSWTHKDPFIALLKAFESVLVRQAGEGWRIDA